MSSRAPVPRWITEPWVRIALGLALLGLCAGLAFASATLPYVTIHIGPKVHPIMGAEQTANLHLVLFATGTLGAFAAVGYALSRRPMTVTFFALGGIALLFSAFLALDAHWGVSHDWVRDAKVYAALSRSGGELRLGNALWASLASAVGILLLAVVVLLVSRATPPPPPRPRTSRF